MASQLLAGIAQLTVDGATYMLEGEAKYQAASVKRESLVGQDTVHGFKSMPLAPYISMSVRDSGGLTVADFNSMTDVTVVLQLANGKVIVGRNMWTVEAQEVDTVEAKFEVRFEGPQVTEQLAS